MKLAERQEARNLRRTGWSLKGIAKALAVSVSSVSAWVSDIELTEEQIRLLEERQRKSRQYIIERAEKLRRTAAVARAEQRKQGFERAKSDEAFRIICALYWGEGRKAERNCSFATYNSDPRLLSIVLRWLLSTGHEGKICLRVQYYQENGLTERAIEDWWLAKMPGLEERHFRNFTRNVVHRASQRKHQGKLPYGTATLQVCSTALYWQVIGGIDYLTQMGT